MTTAPSDHRAAITSDAGRASTGTTLEPAVTPKDGRHPQRRTIFEREQVTGSTDPGAVHVPMSSSVLHQSCGTPTIVIRDSFTPASKTFTRAYLITRSPKRLDLAWTRPAGSDAHAAPVIVLPGPLRFGAGATVAELLATISHVGQPMPDDILATNSRRNPQGSLLYFLLAVPNLRSGDHHLIAGRLPSALADALRQAAHQQGSLVRIPPAAIPADLPSNGARCPTNDPRSPPDAITNGLPGPSPARAFTSRAPAA